MSYKTYTTEAIVAGSRANNTSDKAFLLFTREAGMLWASAKSVREERSRQRFALQDFSLIRVSLIKGKSGWRIGSAESEANYFTIAKTKEERHKIAVIVKLLRQFIHGDVSHPAIFEDAKTALQKIVEPNGPTDELLAIFSLRFLNRLGYIASPGRFSAYLEATEWWSMPSIPKEAQVAIEKAKEASHL